MPQSSTIRMITQAVHASEPVGSAAQSEQTSPPDEAATENSSNSPSADDSDSEHADTTDSGSEPVGSAAQSEQTSPPNEAATENRPNSPSTDDSDSEHADTTGSGLEHDDTTDSDDSDSEPTVTLSTRIMRSGANRHFGRSLLALCDTYLAGARPTTLQALGEAAFDRYKQGGLTPEQLAACIGSFYEAISAQEVACHEHAVWLSHIEQKHDHWLKLGFSEYHDYLVSIDPCGNARGMITRHRQTLDRKACAKKALDECWGGYHELLGLVTPKQGEQRWRTLAALARATVRAPEVAKHCVKMAILKRFQCNTGRALLRSFTVQDFVAAKKMVKTIDRALCPWDDETYEGISEYGLKIYQGLVMCEKKHPGKVDKQRTSRPPTETPAPEPSSSSASAETPAPEPPSPSASAETPAPEPSSSSAPAENPALDSLAPAEISAPEASSSSAPAEIPAPQASKTPTREASSSSAPAETPTQAVPSAELNLNKEKLEAFDSAVQPVPAMSVAAAGSASVVSSSELSCVPDGISTPDCERATPAQACQSEAEATANAVPDPEVLLSKENLEDFNSAVQPVPANVGGSC